jgi:hypothetical protein
MPAQRAKVATSDHLLYFANRLFFRHIFERRGLGSKARWHPLNARLVDHVASPELIACREGIRRVVAWFIQPVLDGDPDATPAEFTRQILAELEKAGRVTDGFRQYCRAAVEHQFAPKPFAREMARPIEEWTEGEWRLAKEKLRTAERFESYPA